MLVVDVGSAEPPPGAGAGAGVAGTSQRKLQREKKQNTQNKEKKKGEKEKDKKSFYCIFVIHTNALRYVLLFSFHDVGSYLQLHG